MAQQQSSSGIVAGAITIIGLGLVWAAVAANFPSQEELSPAPISAKTRQLDERSSPVVAPPTLDLTIPTSPPLPSRASLSRSDLEWSRDSRGDAPVATRLDPRAVQVAKLRCEAEIQKVCPESQDGSARSRCVEQRAKQLSPHCQSQVREQFVKWREDQNRMIAACGEDTKLFCRAIKPESGQLFQCLASHASKVSDRCYQTLPKGTVYSQ